MRPRWSLVAVMDPPAGKDATYVARAEHCYYCCEVLDADLAHRPIPDQVPFPAVHEKLYVAH